MSEECLRRDVAAVALAILVIACGGSDPTSAIASKTAPSSPAEPPSPTPPATPETAAGSTGTADDQPPPSELPPAAVAPTTPSADPDPEPSLPALDLELLPPPPPKGSYAPPTPAELAAAASEDNREYCVERWPVSKRPTVERSKTCARFWLIHEGYEGRFDDFGYDPITGSAPFIRLTARTLQVLANRVRGYCGTECDETDARAIDLFEINASYHYRFMEQRPEAPEMTALFRVLLAGQPIDEARRHYEPETSFDDMLAELSPMSLFRLRNAPYARHGRPFRHEDLQSFFYDAIPPYPAAHAEWTLEERTECGGFPLPLDPAFDDAKLTAVDHANIARLRAIERRVRTAPR